MDSPKPKRRKKERRGSARRRKEKKREEGETTTDPDLVHRLENSLETLSPLDLGRENLVVPLLDPLLEVLEEVLDVRVLVAGWLGDRREKKGKKEVRDEVEVERWEERRGKGGRMDVP